MEMTNEAPISDNQIIITDIRYDETHAKTSSRNKERPVTATLDIPDSLMKTKNNDELFRDNVETFAYNTLSRKYGAEVCHCQIWLPPENEN